MKYLYLLTTVIILASCQNSSDKKPESIQNISEVNPPAKGFDLEGSDSAAIEIANQVMVAMGGREAWDQTKYLKWNFFGARRHLWDKHSGIARVEDAGSDLKIIVDINSDSLTGKVWKDGAELTNPDSLKKYLQFGKSAWINDSYWLVMPFKLKDSGVTLKYKGEDMIKDSVTCDVLNLSFNNVGDTPENSYDIWVDKKSNLIKQWAFYKDSTQDSANWVLPWDNYKQYGGILLADKRGKSNLTEIAVLDSVSNKLFTTFE